VRLATSTECRARRALVVIGIVALATGLGCGPPQPSILLVTLDTFRRDHSSVYGGREGITPNLDALAAEGLTHSSAYTTMPTTGPAHLSIFTGLLPSEHGARSNGETLDPQMTNREVGVRLRRAGYATAAFVTSRMVAPGATGLRGFEIYDAPRGALRPGASVVESTLAWLAVEKRRPVFLWVHLYDPHAPYGSADEKRRSFPVQRTDYGWVAPGRYATPETRTEMAERYARGVANADAALGALVAGVRGAVAEPLLVIVTADHGESLDEHLSSRGFAYDHGKFLDIETVRVPMVLAGAGVSPGRSEGAASIRDLYTVLLETAGIPDDRARDEGRRDLRRPDAARRVVRIERRRFVSAVRDEVRSHGSASADGDALVVVSETGEHSAGPATADLLEAARISVAISEGTAATARESIDPETRRALEELGYVE
jgi:arylsulfatase A-like enzyme